MLNARPMPLYDDETRQRSHSRGTLDRNMTGRVVACPKRIGINRKGKSRGNRLIQVQPRFTWKMTVMRFACVCVCACWRPAVEWNGLERFDIPQLTAKPGSPCFNFRGFCDVFHKCREVITITLFVSFSLKLCRCKEAGDIAHTQRNWLGPCWRVQVDPTGPLANLKKLLFSTDNAIVHWLSIYWYIPAACVACLLTLAAVRSWRTSSVQPVPVAAVLSYTLLAVI